MSAQKPSIASLAKKYHRSESTIRRWLREGAPEGIRFGKKKTSKKKTSKKRASSITRAKKRAKEIVQKAKKQAKELVREAKKTAKAITRRAKRPRQTLPDSPSEILRKLREREPSHEEIYNAIRKLSLETGEAPRVLWSEYWSPGQLGEPIH